MEYAASCFPCFHNVPSLYPSSFWRNVFLYTLTWLLCQLLISAAFLMYYWFMYVRPSVDDLYRDGTVHTSHEMHKQCFIPRSETTSGDRQTSLTDLSLAIGTAYESIYTFVSSPNGSRSDCIVGLTDRDEEAITPIAPFLSDILRLPYVVLKGLHGAETRVLEP